MTESASGILQSSEGTSLMVIASALAGEAGGDANVGKKICPGQLKSRKTPFSGIYAWLGALGVQRLLEKVMEKHSRPS